LLHIPRTDIGTIIFKLLVMKKTFLPTTDSGRELWLKNFAAKLSQYAAKYGISAAEVADVQLSSLNLTYYLNVKTQIQEYYHRCTQFKTELQFGIVPGTPLITVPVPPTFAAAPAPVASGIFDRIGTYTQRIKKHMSYLESDGNDLGIESPETAAVDINTVKPVISVRLIDAGRPEIVWKKAGMSAIEIFVDRGNGFQFLAFDTTPNYIDDFPIEAGHAEVWKYKAVYIRDSKMVGQFSDEVKITVTGELRA
jgi:hypothetical protein